MQLVTVNNGEARTTTLAIAEGTESEHKAVIQLVRKYQSDLEQFGRVTFEMLPFETAGGTQTREIAHLNEHQSTLIMSYMKNTPIIRQFKTTLVKSFYELASRPQIQTPEMMIAHAVLLAEKMISEQKQLIEHLTPKAAFFDAVTDSKDAVDIGTVAKVLNCGIGRNRMFELLRNSSILMHDNKPYQKYIDCGYFRVIESSYVKPDGSTHISFKTVVYQKGIDFIRRRMIDIKEAA